MARRCRACGGIYRPIQRDGSGYAHVCPPRRIVRVERDGARDRVALDDLRPTDIVPVLRDGQETDTPVALMQPGDLRIGDRLRRRLNARDENIDPGKVAAANAETPLEELIVSPGAGADDVEDPAASDERDAF